MNIKLRKFKDIDDTRYIFEFMNKNNRLNELLCTTFDEFESFLMDKIRYDFHDLFMVTDADNERIIGCVYSYDYRTYDSHCKIELLMDESSEVASEIINCFVDYLFKEYPLNRIFVEITNEESVKLYEDNGFDKEAELKQYIYKDGRYHDVIICARGREKRRELQ